MKYWFLVRKENQSTWGKPLEEEKRTNKLKPNGALSLESNERQIGRGEVPSPTLAQLITITIEHHSSPAFSLPQVMLLLLIWLFHHLNWLLPQSNAFPRIPEQSLHCGQWHLPVETRECAWLSPNFLWSFRSYFIQESSQFKFKVLIISCGEEQKHRNKLKKYPPSMHGTFQMDQSGKDVVYHHNQSQQSVWKYQRDVDHCFECKAVE